MPIKTKKHPLLCRLGRHSREISFERTMKYSDRLKWKECENCGTILGSVTRIESDDYEYETNVNALEAPWTETIRVEPAHTSAKRKTHK
jgi:hypothetical protein